MRVAAVGDNLRRMHTQNLEYTVDGKRYVGFLAVDRSRSDKRPGILLAPEGSGVGDVQRERARRLAGLGYVALVLDYHGDGAVLAGPEMMQALGALRENPDKIRAIGRTGLELLAAQPETDRDQLAATGYCYGGTAALELARSGADLKCVVGFHSGLATSRPEDAKHIKAKVLVCIGADDPLIPPEQRLAFEAEMRAAKLDWRMYIYGNAVHGFANPMAGAMNNPTVVAYHQATDERSWREMRDLFDETFGAIA